MGGRDQGIIESGSVLQRGFSTTSGAIFAALKFFTPAVASATVAAVAHEGIQIARQLDASATKDSLKHYFALGASTAHSGIMLINYLNFINEMMISGIWSQLTPKQRYALNTLTFVGALAGGASLSYFGIEENTLVAGATAIGSELTVSSVRALSNFFAARNMTHRFAELPQELDQEFGRRF